MSSRPRLAQLLIWQGWAVLSALVPSLAVSLLWAPGTPAWKLVTLGWVTLWVLYLAVWLPLRFFRLGYRLEADRVLITDRGAVSHRAHLPIGCTADRLGFG